VEIPEQRANGAGQPDDVEQLLKDDSREKFDVRG
jgi:hypothetical protein